MEQVSINALKFIGKSTGNRFLERLVPLRKHRKSHKLITLSETGGYCIEKTRDAAGGKMIAVPMALCSVDILYIFNAIRNTI